MTASTFKVKATIAALKNVATFMALVEKLRSRHPHLPGIGVFSGPSGFGKTYAAIYAQNKTRALRVEVGDSWSKKTFLRHVLAEAGVEGRGTIADMAEQAIMVLGDDPDRPLIIDEADKLVDKGNIEIARELQEMTKVPMLLIGEEQLPFKLKKFERVDNRVLDWRYAEPCDIEDTRTLAELICPDLGIADDLIDAIRGRSAGRARRIVVNLTKVEEYARNTGTASIDLAAYSGGFFTGDAPSRARRAG
ncbi:MAG TPA: ATP-binding protein [Hyphomicrobiales bacterium]|nr:ATP-binding protein [Kaistiaceae bacterium]HQF29955.1 ATP-binding protein [Hyphomicrobiales bacterium]